MAQYDRIMIQLRESVDRDVDLNRNLMIRIPRNHFQNRNNNEAHNQAGGEEEEKEGPQDQADAEDPADILHRTWMNYDPTTCIFDIEWDDLGILVELKPTMRYISRHLLPRLRSVYIKLISDIDTANNMEDSEAIYKKLLLTQLVVLAPKIDEEWSVTHSIKLVTEGKWGAFRLGDFQLRHQPGHRMNSTKLVNGKQVPLKHARAMQNVSKGEVTKAANALFQHSINIPKDQNTLKTLKKLHPLQCQPDIELVVEAQAADDEESARFILDIGLVKKLTLRSKSLKCPSGTTSNRVDIFKQLIGRDGEMYGAEFLASFTDFLGDVCNNNIPPRVMTFLAGGEMKALGKKSNDVNDPRPIAMCECIRKLALKIVNSDQKDAIMHEMAGVNYATNGPNGTEKLTHLVNTTLDLHPDWDVAETDVKAAFQGFDRAPALADLKKGIPKAHPMYDGLYRERSKIWYQGLNDGPEDIASEKGAHQGCTAGLQFFAFASINFYRELQQKMAERGGVGYIKFYSDNGIAAGTHEDVINTMQHYAEHGPRNGQVLGHRQVLLGRKDSMEIAQLHKQAYLDLGFEEHKILLHPDNVMEGEERTAATLIRGIVFLGIPSGSNEFVRAWLTSKLQEKNNWDRLWEMDDTQTAWVIFSKSINNKFNYLCRSINPILLIEYAQAISEMLRNCLEHIIRNKIHDRAWIQTQLAVKTGGLGIKSIEDECIAAYTASFQEALTHTCNSLPELAYQVHNAEAANSAVNKCHSLLAYMHCKTMLTTIAADNDMGIDSFNDTVKVQHTFSKVMNQARFKRVRDDINTHARSADKARFRHIQGAESGAWLWALPSSDLTTIQPRAFQDGIALRLGLPLANLPTTCICKSPIDRTGTHILTCTHGSGNHVRHNSVQDILAYMGRRGGTRSVKEPRDFDVVHEEATPIIATPNNRHPRNGPKGKRGDIKFPGLGVGGKDLLVDITFTDPRGTANLARNAHKTTNRVFELMEKVKDDKYKDICIAKNMSFSPAAYTVFGSWSEKSHKLFDKLVDDISTATGTFKTQHRRYYTQAISCQIVSANGKIILSRSIDALQPTPSHLEFLTDNDYFL